ncbi:MAG: 2-phosphosulfolactate phosphatase, partial [Nitrospinota bacterium]
RGRRGGRGRELTDSALACWNLYERHREDLLAMLRDSSWGRHLQRLGLGPDLAFCARADWSRAVPVFAGGVIRPGK